MASFGMTNRLSPTLISFDKSCSFRSTMADEEISSGSMSHDRSLYKASSNLGSCEAS